VYTTHFDLHSTNRATADHSRSVSASVATASVLDAVATPTAVEEVDDEVVEDIGLAIAAFLIQSLYITPGLVALLHAVYFCAHFRKLYKLSIHLWASTADNEGPPMFSRRYTHLEISLNI